MSTDAWIEEHGIGEAVLPRPRRAPKLPALPVPHARPCCTDQLGWGLGPRSVEDVLPCESGTWRSLVRVAPRQSLRERQSGLSSPRWEGATPIHNPLGCPLCHSKPMPIAVITSPSSRIG